MDYVPSFVEEKVKELRSDGLSNEEISEKLKIRLFVVESVQGAFLVKPKYGITQLQQSITQMIGRKNKPMNGCKIRWYNDAMEMIRDMKSHMTEAQYKKLKAWAN